MPKLPLENIRIADFTWAWAGGFAISILASMGAEVIKVESQRRMEHARLISFSTGELFSNYNQSSVFHQINLNKMSVTLNLTRPEGVELAGKIIAVSDIAAQNMRPGVMERLGLGYDEVKKIKPDIVYLSSSACGSQGPQSKYIGYAPHFAALAGASDVTGYPDGTPAYMLGEIDIFSAVTSAYAVLAALYHRQETGRGQHIDVSSTEVISALIGNEFVNYSLTGKGLNRQGNRDGGMAPHNCYRCRGYDRWLSVAAADENEWAALCAAMGNPDWTRDARFASLAERLGNQEELDKLVEAWTVKYESYELMKRLQEAGVAAMPSFNGEDLASDPHLKARNFWAEVDHPVIGKKTVCRAPWNSAGGDLYTPSRSPLLGEHNRNIFGELLGISQGEIKSLEEKEIIY